MKPKRVRGGKAIDFYEKNCMAEKTGKKKMGKTQENMDAKITDFCGFRNMEDFVTWVDSSKIKRAIMQYRDKMDDYELL
jgi:ppGpp synthetase/RelA/SpoT-type nucleotidyltranferase